MSDLFLKQKLKMMNELLTLTISIDSLLQAEEYEEMNNILNRRAQIMKQIDAIDLELHSDYRGNPIHMNIKNVVKQIIAHDLLIKPKIEALRMDASSQLNKFNTAKTVTKGYAQTSQTDSIFFDKKN